MSARGESQPFSPRVCPAGLYTRVASAIALGALIAACSSNDSPPLASSSIGAAGGAVSVPDGCPALIVPADALDADVELAIHDGLHSIVPGYIDIGQAYLFSPARTSFAVSGRVVLPYDPSAVPSSVDDLELRVGYRDAAGRVSGLVPLEVDPYSGRITVEAKGLGAFWATSPDVVAGQDLFPLQNNDYYRFESDVIVSVSHTEVEPSFAPDRVARVAVSHHGAMFGYYFGNGGQCGRFDVADAQEIFAPSVVWLSGRDAIGVVRPAVTTFTGYRPYGDSAAAYTGVAEVTTEIAERVPVRGPLGEFDTVRVTVTTLSLTTEPVLGEDFVEFWFAPRIGPVQVRFGRNATPLRLVEAMVAGQVVLGL